MEKRKIVDADPAMPLRQTNIITNNCHRDPRLRGDDGAKG
jgi:hypothetical protein